MKKITKKFNGRMVVSKIKVCGRGRKNGGQDIKVLCRSYRTWLLALPGMAISLATDQKCNFISFC